MLLAAKLSCFINQSTAFGTLNSLHTAPFRRTFPQSIPRNNDYKHEATNIPLGASQTSQEQDNEVETMIELGHSELQPYYDFPLDDWQLQAGGAILQGHNVIVSAPTGAGEYCKLLAGIRW